MNTLKPIPILKHPRVRKANKACSRTCQNSTWKKETPFCIEVPAQIDAAVCEHQIGPQKVPFWISGEPLEHPATRKPRAPGFAVEKKPFQNVVWRRPKKGGSEPVSRLVKTAEVKSRGAKNINISSPQNPPTKGASEKTVRTLTLARPRIQIVGRQRHQSEERDRATHPRVALFLPSPQLPSGAAISGEPKKISSPLVDPRRRHKCRTEARINQDQQPPGRPQEAPQA
ncbi:uncharacterized protein LOC129743374 [Uranotaenia lowii]|uniref:uncharacterized protein LOC129743374 n=1 Tax=Uranotaenia lowii TaxID=190385 RepID=UPI00247AE051|nr:uncharacterized protein LOC129743374 [Uranotaenia lowii]